MTYNDLTQLEIDLSAILHNITAIKGLLAHQHLNPVGILAVVKSDAYGHGMIQVAKTILPHVWGLAVFDVNEAITLRAHGIACPVVLISGILPEDAPAVCEHKLIPGLCDMTSLNALENVCNANNTTCEAHIKVDTGMSRMGFTPQEALAIWQQREKWPHIAFTGLFSHLCCADEPTNSMNMLQIDAFEGLRQRILNLNPKGVCFHLANSAGMLHFPQAHYDLIRPGLAIYGGYINDKAISLITLKQAMSLKSRIVVVKHIYKGTSVSYGTTYTAPRDMKIAVIPVGYDNGYFRSLSNRAHVLIKGKRAPVIGRICMRSMMIDVTHIPGEILKEDVVLLGSQGNDNISWQELAQWAGTIDYELMCAIGAKNYRRFIKES